MPLKLTQKQIEETAMIAGLAVSHWEGTNLYVRSDGCKGGVRWAPWSSNEDALTLALSMGITIDFSQYSGLDDFRDAAIASALEL